MTRNRREIGPAKRIRIRIGKLFVNYWKYAMYCVHDSRKILKEYGCRNKGKITE